MELEAWLREVTAGPGPFEVERLSGGNSNETLGVTGPSGRYILRRPPTDAIDSSAHSMAREHRVLEALHRSGAVPVPRPIAVGDPGLLMERVDGGSLTARLPAGSARGAASRVGEQAIDALADLHSIDWRAAGLGDFGRPEAFLERQVGRWSAQAERHRHRDLPWFSEVAAWLAEHRPADGEPGILHGDFHVDNCLFDGSEPVLRAVIDWEMATIGDPLLDVGLMLGFWGPDRCEPVAMAQVQGLSRAPRTVTRDELAARYAARSGRSLDALPYYMALAFFKLAAIVEGAHQLHVQGALDTPYARALGDDVPGLLADAARFAGLH